MPSNGTIANVELYDLDRNFQGNTFQVAIFTSKRWKCILLLPWYRKSDIGHRMVPLRMLHIMTSTCIFQVTNSECDYLENDESWQRMLKYICHRMGTFWIWYFIFKVKHFLVLHAFTIKLAKAADVPYRFDSTRAASAGKFHLLYRPYVLTPRSGRQVRDSGVWLLFWLLLIVRLLSNVKSAALVPNH